MCWWSDVAFTKRVLGQGAHTLPAPLPELLQEACGVSLAVQLADPCSS